MTQTPLQKAHEERLDVGEGLTIFVRSWRPEASARGVVVIVPGFNSHSGYYGWAAEQLVAGGLSVRTFSPIAFSCAIAVVISSIHC